MLGFAKPELLICKTTTPALSLDVWTSGWRVKVKALYWQAVLTKSQLSPSHISTIQTITKLQWPLRSKLAVPLGIPGAGLKLKAGVGGVLGCCLVVLCCQRHHPRQMEQKPVRQLWFNSGPGMGAVQTAWVNSNAWGVTSMGVA